MRYTAIIMVPTPVEFDVNDGAIAAKVTRAAARKRDQFGPITTSRGVFEPKLMGVFPHIAPVSPVFDPPPMAA